MRENLHLLSFNNIISKQLHKLFIKFICQGDGYKLKDQCFDNQNGVWRAKHSSNFSSTSNHIAQWGIWNCMWYMWHSDITLWEVNLLSSNFGYKIGEAHL